MVTVILEGHENYYGLSDVLRLFYGKAEEKREEHLLLCDGRHDLTIISRIAPDGSIRTFPVGEEEAWEKRLIERFGNNVPDPKREVKRQLYFLLSNIEGLSFPWGSLTGIRPTAVAREVGSAGELSDLYMVRPDKAKLCMNVARNEDRVLQRQREDSLNVYVGVPFCPGRCSYCSFVSQDITSHMNKLPKYAEALCEEIGLIGTYLPKIASLYMGGGTPTSFEARDLYKVLDKITGTIKFEDDAEITVEAGRADTITEEKLRILKDMGVQRICINPQTMRDETLKRVGRRHTVSDFISCFELARKIGFKVINSDLIAGLDPESPEELIYSLEELFKLQPENITIHTLYKKRRSSLTRQEVLGGLSVGAGIGNRSLDEVLSKAYDMLEASGYEAYYMYRQKDTSHGLENVGFSRKGLECIYNVAMMSDRRNVVSFGAGSVSKRLFEHGRLERCSSPKDVVSYIDGVVKTASEKTDFFGLR